MGRAAAGDGSIYQRKSGDGRWVGSFLTRGGKRKYVYGKTQKEAKEKLRRAQQDDEQGRLVKATPQTVGAYLQEWVEIRRRTSNLRPGTADGYRRSIRLHIVPTLGALKLQKLTTEAIQKWLVDLLATLATR